MDKRLNLQGEPSLGFQQARSVRAFPLGTLLHSGRKPERHAFAAACSLLRTTHRYGARR